MHLVTAWIPSVLSAAAAESAVKEARKRVGGIKGGKSRVLESAVESPWTKNPCSSEI